MRIGTTIKNLTYFHKQKIINFTNYNIHLTAADLLLTIYQERKFIGPFKQVLVGETVPLFHDCN